MTIPIVEILNYGMTGLVVSSIGCIMFDVELMKFRHIVTTITIACLIKKTLDYM